MYSYLAIFFIRFLFCCCWYFFLSFCFVSRLVGWLILVASNEASEFMNFTLYNCTKVSKSSLKAPLWLEYIQPFGVSNPLELLCMGCLGTDLFKGNVDSIFQLITWERQGQRNKILALSTKDICCSWYTSNSYLHPCPFASARVSNTM